MPKGLTVKGVYHILRGITHKEINNTELKVKQDYLSGSWAVVDCYGEDVGRLMFYTKEDAKAHRAIVKAHMDSFKEYYVR